MNYIKTPTVGFEPTGDFRGALTDPVDKITRPPRPLTGMGGPLRTVATMAVRKDLKRKFNSFFSQTFSV